MRNPLVKGRMYHVTGGGAIKGFKVNKSGMVSVLVQPGAKKGNPKKRNLFGFGKKTKRRLARAGLSRSRYMVLDRDGLPVHSGRDLTKKEALQIAKSARKDGEKGIHLKRSNPRKLYRKEAKKKK